MARYIDKDRVVAEIKKRINNITREYQKNKPQFFLLGKINGLENIISFIDTLEVKEVDLNLITGWFDHIAQIADDRMTLTRQRMTDAHALNEIKCIAKNSSEFITKHYKAQKGK